MRSKHILAAMMNRTVLICGLSILTGAASATTVQSTITLFSPSLINSKGYGGYNSLTTFQQGQTPGDTQINFMGLWGQFGRAFDVPQDWSQINGFQVTIKNQMNFPVSLGFRVWTTQAGDKYLQTDFNLAPKQSVQYFVDRSNFDSASMGMMFPPPVFNTPYIRITPSLESPTPKVYKWMIYYRGTDPASVSMSTLKGLTVTNNDFNGIVDQYGQYTQRSWLEKVTKDSDFAKSTADEDADLANNPGPGETDGSHTLAQQQATGKWHMVKLASGKWYFVHPNGRLFWTFGLCSVGASQPTVCQGREFMFTSLPDQNGPFGPFFGNSGGKTTFDLYRANLSRKYGATWATDWAARANRRMNSWGFNTLGAGHDMVLHQYNMPFTQVLLTSGYPSRIQTPFAFWNTLPDAFGSDFQSWMVSNWASTVNPLNGKPNFMGVEVDAEQSWGAYGNANATYQLPVGVLNSPISQPAKAAFVAQLQAKYSNSITAFNKAWGTNFASFAALGPAFDLSQSNLTAQCVVDCSQFLTAYAVQYYSKVRAALNQLNCTALYLGSRNVWAWTPTEIYSAEEPYVDVHSVNYYGAAYEIPWATFASWNKPTMIGEFAFGTEDRGLFSGGFIADMSCTDQGDRAAHTMDYLQTAATQNNVVGAHWYTYIDMPIIGSLQDQQNLGIGTVDVTDQPYYPLVNTFRSFASNLYKMRGQ